MSTFGQMEIRASTLIDLLRRAAPEASAESWDRVGWQCGDPELPVQAVVIALDVRPETIECAIREEAGLLIAHHPLLFEPVTRIDPHSFPGRELTALIENRITLYVAHTNVDRSPTLSLNAAIGRRLPLKSHGPMASKWQDSDLKLVAFVPLNAVGQVRAALAEAGAGQIGEYTNCSFAIPGTGTFLGSESSSPTVGEKGKLETVEEIRLEMICPKRGLNRILRALWDSHPYEEVAYDLYPLSGYEDPRQFLWAGELAEETTLSRFAGLVRECLGDGLAPVKFAGDPGRRVKRVAWCSGGGKSLVKHLLPSDTDVYLTGDTGHHDALACLSKGIVLVDLDHYYTERLFLETIRDYLLRKLPDGSVRWILDPSGPVYHPC